MIFIQTQIYVYIYDKKLKDYLNWVNDPEFETNEKNKRFLKYFHLKKSYCK